MSAIVQHAPKFTENDANRMAKALYDLDVSAKLLPSERDQNFHLTTANNQAYVLKIANSMEPEAVLDFQNQAMMHIRSKDHMQAEYAAPAPQVCLSVEGEQISTIQSDDGARYFVRLLTYLPGRPLALIRPHDTHLLDSLGRFFGTLDMALQDFEHPAAKRDFHWDLKNAARILTNYIDLIKDRQHRNMVQQFFGRYRAEAEPQIADLRSSIIHSDGNDYNVLVEQDGRWRHKVSGVIDFGDMVYTQTINEVAIVCAYAMLDKADPLATASAIVGGYHQVFPLADLPCVAKQAKTNRDSC
jgi:Ser/Thr protein kinase RdoA (MazF antagonist)